MKLLKIESDIGYFLDDKGGFAAIDKVAKEDLLRLVEQTLIDEVEFDPYKEESIKNHAQQIVYKNIFDKLRGLKERKQEFKDQSDRLYLQEYEKYREVPIQQST